MIDKLHVISCVTIPVFRIDYAPRETVLVHVEVGTSRGGKVMDLVVGTLMT